MSPDDVVRFEDTGEVRAPKDGEWYGGLAGQLVQCELVVPSPYPRHPPVRIFRAVTRREVEAEPADIAWLASHCRAIGMTEEAIKEDRPPGSLVRDICLFTIHLKHRAETAERERDALRTRLAELEAVVAGIPKTKDGVPPTHCATVYYRFATIGADIVKVRLDAPGGMIVGETDPEDGWVPLNECYSTSAAAEAALRAGGGA